MFSLNDSVRESSEIKFSAYIDKLASRMHITQQIEDVCSLFEAEIQEIMISIENEGIMMFSLL